MKLKKLTSSTHWSASNSFFSLHVYVYVWLLMYYIVHHIFYMYAGQECLCRFICEFMCTFERNFCGYVCMCHMI